MKPAVPNKVISLNDLEEGVKLTILSDIERDQRINDNNDAIEKLENKRKQDHTILIASSKKRKKIKLIWRRNTAPSVLNF